MRPVQSDYLERTSSELEGLQREARTLGLLSVAYMIELAREEIIDEILRSGPRPKIMPPEIFSGNSNVLALNPAHFSRRKTS